MSGFEDGTLDQNRIMNFDETHFIINMDRGRTLGFVGEESISYADVVSGTELSKIKDAWMEGWNKKRLEMGREE